MHRFFFAALLIACLSAQVPSQGTGARATPADYQAHAQAGTVTIAADFAGHSVPTPEAVFNTEDFVTVEVGLFGPAGSHLVLRPEDFTIRMKGRKQSLGAQPYAVVFHGLKDPEWEQSVAVAKNESASKTSIGGGGGGGGNDPPPAPPKMPIATERKMEQRVQKAALPEGDRPLPQGGLIFFSYHGKTSNMQGLELVYQGAAGKAAIPLQP